MEPNAGIKMGLHVMTNLTLFLMILSTALPRWYVYGSTIFGLWKACSSSTCITISAGGRLLVIAQVLAIGAILTVFASSLLCIAIDRNASESKTKMKLPSSLLGLAAFLYGGAIGTYMAWASISGDGGHYGASFGLAWVSVVTVVASSGLAHVHHKRLAATA